MRIRGDLDFREVEPLGARTYTKAQTWDVLHRVRMERVCQHSDLVPIGSIDVYKHPVDEVSFPGLLRPTAFVSIQVNRAGLRSAALDLDVPEHVSILDRFRRENSCSYLLRCDRYQIAAEALQSSDVTHLNGISGRV